LGFVVFLNWNSWKKFYIKCPFPLSFYFFHYFLSLSFLSHSLSSPPSLFFSSFFRCCLCLFLFQLLGAYEVRSSLFYAAKHRRDNSRRIGAFVSAACYDSVAMCVVEKCAPYCARTTPPLLKLVVLIMLLITGTFSDNAGPAVTLLNAAFGPPWRACTSSIPATRARILPRVATSIGAGSEALVQVVFFSDFSDNLAFFSVMSERSAAPAAAFLLWASSFICRINDCRFCFASIAFSSAKCALCTASS
jgi:hypothetical protein